jgi:uncharacterized membrane protein YbaN (DUF454 family)
VRTGLARYVWFGLGWVAVGVGSIGVVVPGLPTTVFFLVAASCFGRSSPRFERWVLGLPRIGPLVRDYRAGLGMPRKAKVFAIATIVVVCSISALLTSSSLLRGAVLGAGLVGCGSIMWRVPTREHVLAAAAPTASPSS